LGAYNPIKRVVIIDSSLKSDIQKFNFTLAHELGHLALHRNLKFKYNKHDANNEEETIMEASTKKKLKTDSDWMEWQANYYASSLLMPAEIFKTALVIEQNKLGISRTGMIYVDNQPCNQQAFYQLINLLSQRFEVSKSAVEYRLQKLKLVDDKRKNFRSVSNILNGLGK
jgi:Zn-dependent peptidase ImmA (M78 family)